MLSWTDDKDKNIMAADRRGSDDYVICRLFCVSSLSDIYFDHIYFDDYCAWYKPPRASMRGAEERFFKRSIANCNGDSGYIHKSFQCDYERLHC
jgi:hypothetical protein